MSGVNAQIIQQMMPVVASMLIGGIANAMAAQGLGGVARPARQRVRARRGPRARAPIPPPPLRRRPAPCSQLDEHGQRHADRRRRDGDAAADAAGRRPAGRPQSLNSMLQAGVQVSQAQQQGLATILEFDQPSAAKG